MMSSFLPKPGVDAHFKASPRLDCMSELSLPARAGGVYVSHTVHSHEYRPGVEGHVGPGFGPFWGGGSGFRAPRTWPRIGGYMFQAGSSSMSLGSLAQGEGHSRGGPSGAFCPGLRKYWHSVLFLKTDPVRKLRVSEELAPY